jgi:hypothetical protein
MADELAERHGLEGPDSVILASLVYHLDSNPDLGSCFVTRNSDDFSDQSVQEELSARGCDRVVFKYAHALAIVDASRT